MSGTAAQVGSGSGSGGDAADKLVRDGFEQPSDTLLRCRCCSFAGFFTALLCQSNLGWYSLETFVLYINYFRCISIRGIGLY